MLRDPKTTSYVGVVLCIFRLVVCLGMDTAGCCCGAFVHTRWELRKAVLRLIHCGFRYQRSAAKWTCVGLV